MLRKSKTLVTGIIIGLLIALLTSTVFGAATENAIKVFYNNIKIFIDGGEFTPKDANGNTVEPFTYNGTTYLPVRAIATAFGKDVVWDGKTQSVYLGKKDQNQPDEYLDRIQYIEFQKADHGSNNLWKINGTITDYLKNDYKNGMLFRVYGDRKIADESDGAKLLIEYPLNSQYNSLKGTIILPQKIDITGLDKLENENGQSITATVLIYGDGALLTKLTEVPTTMPMKFDANVKGVNKITIKIISNTNGWYDTVYIALTDLALYK